MTPPRRAACLALLALLGACAGGGRAGRGREQGEWVEAEGLVPLRPEDLPGARAAALAAAQKSAVERAVGVLVSARTRVDKAVLAESKIMASSAGYVARYEVRKEGPEGGYYRCRIRAFVLLRRVGEDLEEAGLLSPETARVRLSLRLDERVDGAVSESRDASLAAAAVFLERGYPVQAGVSSSQAEVAVSGECRAEQNRGLEASLGGFLSYRARVALEALRPGSGQLLGAATAEASGLGVNKASAAAKALESAARLAAEELEVRLRSALKARPER